MHAEGQHVARRAPRRRPHWFDSTVLGFGLFLIFLLCANYSGQQITDNVSVFTAAWAAGQHGTLDISAAPDIKPWTVLAENGHLYSDRAPGIIAWTTPFFAALGRADFPTTFPAGTAAAASAAIAIAVLFLLFIRLTTYRTALIAALLAAFGTATWTISADAIWPHGPDQLWLTAMMLAMAKGRYLLAGMFGAAALVTRPITAVATACAGLWLALSRRRWKPALHMGLTSSLGLVALLVYNRLLFDEWTLAAGSYQAFLGQFAGRGETYDPTDVMDLATNVAGAIASPSRGVLVLSPFLLLLIPGCFRAWRIAPDWVRASAIAGVSYAAVQVWGNNYAGGAGFYSYRYTIESLTLLSPLLLLSWTTWVAVSRARRTLFGILAVFSVFQHAVGALYITPSLKAGYDSWQHYLLVEALQSSTRLELSFAIIVTCTACLVPFARRRRRTEPFDEERLREGSPVLAEER